MANARVGEKNGGWTIADVSATYLSEGDSFNPLTKTASFTGKTSLSGQESLTQVPDQANIFSFYDDDLGDWTNQRAFTEQAIALVDSTADRAFGTSLERDPGYGVTLLKTPDSEGFVGLDGQGVSRYSFRQVQVEIAPVPEPGAVGALVGLGLVGLGSRLKRR